MSLRTLQIILYLKNSENNLKKKKKKVRKLRKGSELNIGSLACVRIYFLMYLPTPQQNIYNSKTLFCNILQTGKMITHLVGPWICCVFCRKIRSFLHPQNKGFPKNNTKLHLVVRFQFWRVWNISLFPLLPGSL